MSVIVIYLNYYSYTMLTVYAYYADYKNIILSGFDISQSKLCNPTFPMWGYGWFLIFTEKKLLLILMQNILAFASLYYFFYQVTKNQIFELRIIRLFKVLLIIAIPFYAFHSIRWPCSIAISLVIFSLLLFVKGFFYQRNSTLKIVLSGILFGLTLNFRSDYYLVPVGFVIALLLLNKINFTLIKKILFWLGSIYILLVPWIIYTKHVTDHYLLTSTNSGHVTFIGLGNLPDNKWGITEWDKDSVLHQLMYKKYGERKSTLLYETDKFVKEEFKKRVKEDPIEYIRKDIYALKKMLITGVYHGDFHNQEYLKMQPLDTCLARPGDSWEFEDSYYSDKTKYAGVKKKILDNPSQFSEYYSFTHLLRLGFKFISTLFGKITVLISFILLPFGIYYSISKRNYLLIFSILLILYQSAINIFAYSWNLYTANVYVFLLLNIAFTSFYLITDLKRIILKNED